MKNLEKLSFEEAMKVLIEEESLMTDGNLTLSDLMEHFKKGTEAARACLSKLKKAEEDITVITQDIEAMEKGETQHVEN